MGKTASAWAKEQTNVPRRTIESDILDWIAAENMDGRASRIPYFGLFTLWRGCTGGDISKATESLINKGLIKRIPRAPMDRFVVCMPDTEAGPILTTATPTEGNA